MDDRGLMASDLTQYSEETESIIRCFRCGICCTVYQVRMELPEAQQIAENLGLSWHDFLSTYTDKSWPGVESLLICHHNGACVFLECSETSKMTMCQIHAFRPSSCRNWEASIQQPECQKGLLKDWNLTVSTSGRLEGSDSDLQSFYEFLGSLSMSD